MKSEEKETPVDVVDTGSRTGKAASGASGTRIGKSTKSRVGSSEADMNKDREYKVVVWVFELMGELILYAAIVIFVFALLFWEPVLCSY